MEELFKKVYIKSEADLPKWGNCYEIKLHNGEHYQSMQYNQVQNKGWWMTNVLYYLQPLPQPREVTDEMIKEEANKLFPTSKPRNYLSEGQWMGFIKGAKFVKTQMKGGTNENKIG